MRDNRPIDVFQRNADLIARQTGSKVYAPLGVDWMPERPRMQIRLLTVIALGLGGWAVVALGAALVIILLM